MHDRLVSVLQHKYGRSHGGRPRDIHRAGFDTSRIYGNSLSFRDINEETNGGSSLIGFDLYAGREGGLGRNHLDYLHFLIFKADKSKVLKTESSSTSTPKSS